MCVGVVVGNARTIGLLLYVITVGKIEPCMRQEIRGWPAGGSAIDPNITACTTVKTREKKGRTPLTWKIG